MELDEHEARIQRRLNWFLLGWLLLELAGYFALSPFPAARRVMGLVIVTTLLLGRQAARTCVTPDRQRLLTGVTVAGVALGLLFYIVDFRDAWVQREGPEAAAEFIRAQRQDGAGPQPTSWYVGHWGFQFYAEHAGMAPVIPDRSLLRRGDWLIVPDDRWEQQEIGIQPFWAEVVQEITVPETMPLRTVRCFYGGAVPLEHHNGPRMVVTVYKVIADWVPMTPRR